MNRILWLMALSVNSIMAQSQGCYFDFAIGTCVNSVRFSCGGIRESNYALWGTPIGELCDQALNNAALARENATKGEACLSQLVTETSRADTNYAAWLEQKALGTRLRRACGVKCRRIK